MHMGKCFSAMSSTMSAVTSPLLWFEGSYISDDTPAINPFDRFSKMGNRRVSSSNRGKALAVTSESLSHSSIHFNQPYL